MSSNQIAIRRLSFVILFGTANCSPDALPLRAECGLWGVLEFGGIAAMQPTTVLRRVGWPGMAKRILSPDRAQRGGQILQRVGGLKGRSQKNGAEKILADYPISIICTGTNR